MTKKSCLATLRLEIWPRYLAFEGLNGAGKSSAFAALQARCGTSDRVCFAHDPPKHGPWSAAFSQFSVDEKQARLCEVLLLHAACSLREQRLMRSRFDASEQDGVLVGDRSVVSTLAFFASYGPEILQAIFHQHLLPGVVAYITAPPQVIDERLVERRDRDAQLAFNSRFDEGYRRVLPRLRELGMKVYEFDSGLMSANEIAERVYGLMMRL